MRHVYNAVECRHAEPKPALRLLTHGSSLECGLRAFRRGPCRLAAGPDLLQRMEPFEFAVLQAPLMTKGVASPHPQLSPHLALYAARLEAMGGACCPSDASAVTAARAAGERGRPLALLLGTGGTEALALEAADEYRLAHLRTHPGTGDRCAREL